MTTTILQEGESQGSLDDVITAVVEAIVVSTATGVAVQIELRIDPLAKVVNFNVTYEESLDDRVIN